MKSSKRTIQKRQNSILQYLNEHQEADVLALADWLDVSEITVRRDLQAMNQQGLIERFFGGVRLLRSEETGHPATGSASVTDDIREVLATRAAQMIGDKDVVFINSSTTAMRVIKYLQGRAIVVITNNVKSIGQSHGPGVELVLTGGEVYGNKQSLVGEFALNTLAKVKATKCIIGVSGISVKGGITSEVLPETAINQLMLKRCSGSKIVVTDGSKIGRERNFLSGGISDITHLITDASADPAELERLRTRGVIVLVVDSAESADT